MTRVLSIAFLTVLIVGLSVLAGETDRRIPIPDDVFYYQPAASVFGSEAAWTNPAGLGRYGVSGFQLMADYENGDYAKSWGWVLYRDRFTTAYRRIENPDGEDYKEWVAAMGMGMGNSLTVGLSYRYFRSGPGIYDNRHFWTIGLGSRGKGPWSLGAVWSNLNRGKIGGRRSAVEQQYSVSYRPSGTRLTVSADMFLSSRNSLQDAEFKYHAEYILKPGLYVNAFVDSDRNFQFGVRANLLKYFVGSRSSFDKKGHNGRTTVFVGATNHRQPSILKETKRRLTVAVSGRPAENPPRPVFGAKRTPFLDLITTIYRAADDPVIGEMLLDLRSLSLGLGQAQELREAITYFKSEGKAVICHISSPNNVAYFVASAADSILIPPVCQLRLVGLRAELTFWAGTLDKLGVQMEILRVGEYKTAAETYTRRAATEENREQVNHLLDDLYDQFVSSIADGRGLSRDSVKAIIDNGPFTSEEALEFGLVDGLCYRDRVNREFVRTMPELTFRSYQTDTLLNDSWNTAPTLAVVVAEGEIRGGQGNVSPNASGVNPASMARAFAVAKDDPGIKGIVFRVNSPGGAAIAGEQVYHSAATAAERKPFVVSMGNVAASGGYYVAMPAERIFVDPASVTGSIGIYGGKADFSGLFEKIEVGKELYTRGKYAGMLTNTRPFTDEEREKYHSHLKSFYGHFVDLVAENRNLPEDSVDCLSRGKVWTGREATVNGLADQTGGIKQALDYLAGELGFKEYRVEILPRKRPWFIAPKIPFIGSLVSILTGGHEPSEVIPASLPVSEEESVFARMPFDIDIR